MSARPATSEATAPAPGSRNARKVAVAALIGTSIEWYDFFMEIPAVVLAAHWSDRVERSRVILWGGAATLVVAALFLPLVDTRSPILVGLAVLAVRFGLASMYGPVAALLGESFPTTVRYSGVSLAYQLGSIAGGGFSPIVATVLVASPAGSTAVTSYLMAILALSMLGAAGIGQLTRNGHRPAHAPESDPPGLQALNQ